MASCSVPTPEARATATLAALREIRSLAASDPAFADAFAHSASPQEAARLARRHGIEVLPEALWRHRGDLMAGGLPTWRG